MTSSPVLAILKLQHEKVRISVKNKLMSKISSYAGHVGEGKSGLVSTVCACANDSGNFSRTSPIMDKLHVVVMRRDNQTRYTACSLAAWII